MKLKTSITLILAVFCNFSAVAQDAPTESSKITASAFDDQDWPQVYETASGVELAIYQPQVDEWTEYRHMVVRAAIALKPAGAKEEEIVYGALIMESDTTVDKEERVVHFGNRTIKSLTFPNVADEATSKKYQTEVVETLNPTRTLTVNLDRVLANAERAEQQANVKGISNAPPPIFYSDVPAIIVIFLGPAKFEKVENSTLLFGANTNWDVFLDPVSGTYYLLAGKTWLTTQDLMKGPWSSTTTLPASLSALPANEDWKDVLAAIPAQSGVAPKVFVSDRPAELIVTEGKPQFSPIAGTKILEVANTESDILTYAGTYYFLTAGRWFKAAALEGHWTSAMDAIPTAFADIPETHAKAHVLASVPGTPDAEEAIIMAQVPQTAKVSRTDAKLEVKYEGEPEFVAIKGSTVLAATNTPNSVFLTGKRYYCCEKGVWFVANAPTGPWVVCDNVPDEIYTIPASSPHHNVTYVYVYDSDPDQVTVGHTSGYNGAYVVGDLLLFGAGIWLASEILDDWDNHWHHCGWHYHSCAWSYGCAVRYNHYHGGYYRYGSRYYGPYGGAGAGAVYNPWTGGYARAGHVYGPRGSAYAREAYNPWTDTYGARVGASTPYGSWGRSVVSRDDEWARAGYNSGRRGTVAGIGTSEGAGAIKVNRRYGSDSFIAKNKNDDLYVGRDGKIYKREDGEWSKRKPGGWDNVERPGGPAGTTRPGSRPSIQPTRPSTRPSTQPTRPSTRPSTQPTRPSTRPSIQPTRPSTRPSTQPTRPTTRIQPTPRVSPTPRTTSGQLHRDSSARSRGSRTTTRSRSTRSSGRSRRR